MDLLVVEELQKAMIVLLKLHQQEAFTKELHNLQREKEIHSYSKILVLSLSLIGTDYSALMAG